MPHVLISGAIANKCHNGGEAWVRLSWIVGLRELGCEIHFIEQIARENLTDSEGKPAQLAQSVQSRYFRRVCEEFGLADSATLVCDEQSIGRSYEDLLELAGEADLLVNISGHLQDPRLMERIRRKVYVDIDPGYTQFWHEDPNVNFTLAGHDAYYTIAQNIGRPSCGIPTCEIEWKTIWPPVVLSEWPMVGPGEFDRFTTVSSWRGPFGPAQYGGRTFGLKVHEFRKFLALPKLAGQDFEIALQIDPADGKDLASLKDNGWIITNPREVAPDPSRFRQYVQNSSAEFSVAQGVYSLTSSGWFSDRTVRYLASGRPALVQETGFSEHLPTGIGLVSFATIEGAVEGARRIVDDYPAHCVAARRLAEEYFDSRKVLSRFLQENGIS